MLFRCVRSGNVVNIDQQDDIDRMKAHEGYVPVVDYVVEVPNENAKETDEAVQDAKETQVLKQRGRPKKAK